MAGREKGKIPIRDVLKKRDPALYHRLEAIWAIAQELQERQRSKEGHQQGYLHCKAVEGNLEKIITDSEKYLSRYRQYAGVADENDGLYKPNEGVFVRHHSMKGILDLLQAFEIQWLEQLDDITMNRNSVRTFHLIAQKV